MPRAARIVIPGVVYHITHRGDRQEPVFFNNDDYRSYLALLLKYSRKYGVVILAYVLMPNHVHLKVRPLTAAAMSRTMALVAKLHSEYVNARLGTTGHSWSDRFYSTPMDEEHAVMAVHYIHQNPVRAGLVARAEAWPWSSARAYLLGAPDPLVNPDGHATALPPPERLQQAYQALRECCATGRPVGSPEFVRDIEGLTGRDFSRRRRGRPPKERK